MSDDLIGQSMAHYRITAKLGDGGMGELCRTTDSNRGRDCRAQDSAAGFHLRRRPQGPLRERSLATHATCARALRPSRLPISASVDLSGLDRRNRAGMCARRIRFSAAKYSF
ncbi:MAG: hypothetical protein DMG58_25680 [Acidobacteria bacterium]|nr:MAG: hypothetical protein DMG58_25680 [Acidobacteriota bacterium]